LNISLCNIYRNILLLQQNLKTQIWNLQQMRKIESIVIIALLVLSCGKEGEGGNSVITGRVLSKVYDNSFTHLLNTYYKPGTDVYIVYGNSPVYNDHFETSWDGTFRFEYLRKGDYKIFVYSIDTTGENASGLYPATILTTIPGNNSTVTLADIEIIEKCDYDDGTGSITGKIYILDYNAEGTAIIENYYGADEDVFILYGDDPYSFDDVKTFHDGTFRFSNLVRGIYTVYALSRNPDDKTSRKLIPMSITDTIEYDYEDIDVGEIVILK